MTTTNTAQPLRGPGGGHGGRFPGGRGGFSRARGGFPGRRGGWYPPGGYGGFNSCGGCCPGGRAWANVRGLFSRNKAPTPQPPAPAGKPTIRRT